MDPLGMGHQSPIFGRELFAELGADGTTDLRLDNFELAGFEKDGPTRSCRLRGQLTPQGKKFRLRVTTSDCPGTRPGTEYSLSIRLFSPRILKWNVDGTGLPGGLHDFALLRRGSRG